MRPELRGKPVGIVPVEGTDFTCFIAASKEAKAFGVKCGTMIREGKFKCPGLILVDQRPEQYVKFQKQIHAAINEVVPLHRERSIDECEVSLIGAERELSNALAIAHEIKRQIRERVGKYITVSIGISTSSKIAKIAADLQKPDGLTIIQQHELPQRLYELNLTDLPGINVRNQRRLNAHGIYTVEDLATRSKEDLHRAFRSVWGDRWFEWLRGGDVWEAPTVKQIIGGQHVLRPKYRNHNDAKAVLQKLVHRASKRARSMGYVAGELVIFVEHTDNGVFFNKLKLSPPHADIFALLKVLDALWETNPAESMYLTPYIVGVSLTHVEPAAHATDFLFEGDKRFQRLNQAMDLINDRFGESKIFIAPMIGVKDAAPVRIAYTTIPEYKKPAQRIKKTLMKDGSIESLAEG